MFVFACSITAYEKSFSNKVRVARTRTMFLLINDTWQTPDSVFITNPLVIFSNEITLPKFTTPETWAKTGD